MKKISALVLLVLTGCPRPISQPPVLKELGEHQLQVQFIGAPYDPEHLYVCGTLESGKLSCIQYETFMRELERK